MSNTQNFDVNAKIQAVKESNVFKNLCSDIMTLLKTPETWFRSIYEQERMIESLVLIIALILSRSIEIIGVNIAMPQNLNLGFVNYQSYIPNLIVSEVMQYLLFFGMVVLAQVLISARYGKPSISDFKMALTLFSYSFIPLIMVGPLVAVANLIHIGFFDLFGWAFECTGIMLISLGLLSRKNDAIQMNWFILIATVLILGKGLCAFVI